MLLDVIQAALGVAHLVYIDPRYKPAGRDIQRQKDNIFAGKLKSFLAERNLEYVRSPKLTGNSGQVYTVHYKINGAAYLHTLNPGRDSQAKPQVDRTFSMWADAGLAPRQKITLLNDAAFSWKEAHVNRLSQVSQVISWSERDKLVDLLAARH